MDALLDFIQDNPLYAVGIVALLLLFVIALFRKMFKLALLAVVLNVLYVVYLQELAEEAYSDAEAAIDAVRDQAEDLADRVEEALGD